MYARSVRPASRLRHHRRSLVPAAAGLTAVVVLLSGCGSSSKAKGGGFAPAGGDTPTSTAPGVTDPSAPSASASASAAGLAPSAMTTPQFKQAVLSGYKAYMTAYEHAYATNITSTLGQYAADPVLGKVTKEIQADAAKKVVWRFHNVLNPQLQGWATDRTLAVVLDCVQNLGWYKYSLTSGARTGTKSAGNNYYQTHLKYVDAVWKVTEVKVGGRC